MYTGRDLPWLQDVDSNSNNVSDVWYDRWQIVYRDVVILDGNNAQTGVYNLTEHDLANPTAYAEFKEMLLDAAVANQKPWQNPDQPLDCDRDGFIVPRDVLLVINEINRSGARKLPAPAGTTLPAVRYDANGDGFVTSNDVLQIINHINAVGNSGEGEGGEGEGTVAGNSFSLIVAPESASMPGAPVVEAVSPQAELNRNESVWMAENCELTEPDRSSISPQDESPNESPRSTDSLWDQDWLLDAFCGPLDPRGPSPGDSG
jgi:hypothetical protein